MAFKRLDFLARTVLSRLNTDELGGSEMRASPEEKPAGANAPAGSPSSSAGGGAPIADEREEVTRRDHVPGMETVKRPTRSDMHWTVPKPRKRTGTNAAPAAPNQGESVNERSPQMRPTLRIVSRSMIAARSTRQAPASAAVIDLRIVGGRDHGSPSPS